MALSANKRRLRRGTLTLGQGLAAASQTIYDGALVAWNAAGALVPASDATGIEIAGVAVTKYASTSATTMVTYEYGHEEWFPTGAGTIGASSMGLDACAVDDAGIQDGVTSTYRVRVGRITQTESINGVAGAWVHVREHATAVANEQPTTVPLTGPIVVSNIPIGAVAYGSLGTSAVHVAGSLYVSELYLPEPKTVTGVAVLNGATASTDNLIGVLMTSTCAVVATSAIAGTLSANANTFQALDFVAPVELTPGRYFIGVQCDGTTATTRRIAANTYLNRASVTAGIFGTIAPGPAPTTTAADAGPIGYLY